MPGGEIMDFDDIILSHPHDFFRLKRLTVEPGTCFVLMPFAEQFDLVYNTIEDALKGLMVCTRADDLRLGQPILERILQGIATADLIIVDLTGRNPNVFYELALAHTRTKEVLLLTQDIEDVPFDLRGLFCHEYNVLSKANIERLSRVVYSAAKYVASRRAPQALEGVLTRTKRIVDYMEQFLHSLERCKGLVIRIQASISSLGNLARVDAAEPELRAYTQYLEDERELLIRLLENGAALQAILSPYRISIDAREAPSERIARIERVISFLNREDDCINRCRFVVAPAGSPNLLFFGDQILFEGYKTEVERGFAWTQVFSDPTLVNARVRIFDRFFESARRYTIENYGGDKKDLNDLEALRQAVISALNTAKMSPL